MTRNVTLRMDEDLLAELRHRAIDANMSLSAWITTTVQSAISSMIDIDLIREQAIKRMEHGFHLGGKPLSREEIHAR